MRTLSFPRPSNTSYPRLNFTDLNNMRRQTEYNRKAFIDWVRKQPFNVENEHLLVGLLQQLSINPEWDLDYVVGYTRFRAYSLCTLFKITSLHHVGEATDQGFYRNNAREHWCLIENTKQYVMGQVSLNSLRPVVPLCSTITEHGYSHPETRNKRTSVPVGGLAVMGVDLVELAVGWWMYQRLNRERDTGPGAYVAQYPMVHAQLFHNQMCVINALYEHVVHDQALTEFFHADKVTFTTVNERPHWQKLLEFLVSFYNTHRLQNFEHFLSVIDSIYAEPYFNYVQAGKNSLYAQTMWIWEPAILKLYAIYLTFCNRGKYKVSDISTAIVKTEGERLQNFRKVPESYFKGWFIGLSDEVAELNKENFKL